ncbi:MAG: Dps family protein [Sphingomonadaceae bacterium]
MASKPAARRSAIDQPATHAEFEPDTGLEPDAYRAVAECLGPVLADSYQLFIKTQGVHWNVSGPNFYGLHKLTQEQYEDLYAAIDEIAERIRSLGHVAPATYRAYGEMGRIRDEESDATPEAQLRTLIRDNGLLCETLREAIAVAEDHDDVVTADLLTQRLSRHEQNGWMLRMTIA